MSKSNELVQIANTQYEKWKGVIAISYAVIGLLVFVGIIRTYLKDKNA